MRLTGVLAVVIASQLCCAVAFATTNVLQGKVVEDALCKSGYRFVYDAGDPCIVPTKKVDLRTLVGSIVKLTVSREGNRGVAIHEVNSSELVGTHHDGFIDHIANGVAAVGEAATISSHDQPSSNASDTLTVSLNRAQGDCNPSISIAKSEVQFDEACGPSCSQIRMYPKITEIQFSGYLRHISYKARIRYADGTYLDEVGVGGNDMLSNETSIVTRDNFDSPHMTLTVVDGRKIWVRVPVMSWEFNDLKCTLTSKMPQSN